MNYLAEAQRIYSISMTKERANGDRAWYRKQELMKIPMAGRWIVRQHLNNIAVANKPRTEGWNIKS